eukprot:12122322-Karenia_brevis.AAC.1
MELDDDVLDSLAEAIAGNDDDGGADGSTRACRLATVKANLKAKRKEVASTLQRAGKKSRA